MQRRLFIRRSAISAFALSLPLQALLNSFVDQRFKPWKQVDEFSIIKLNQILGDYQYPNPSSFNPLSYISNYKAISLIQGMEEGQLVFEKKSDPTKISYNFQLQRYIPGGFAYTVKGKLNSGRDGLPWVKNWVSSSMISRNGTETAWLESDRFIKGRINGEKVVIEESGTVKNYNLPLNGHISWKWGLVDLIPLMASRNIQSLTFAALDETDVVYSEQKAKFKMNISISHKQGGNKINFKVYDLTGTGVIPTVYWVDEAGRTVFIITGAEAYILL